MKIITWNVNGIRAATKGGFLDWYKDQRADIVCVQEIKAFQGQVEPAVRNPGQHHSFWNSAEKPGYSGTAIFSKKEPESVVAGIGFKEFDSEGRVLTAEFADFYVVNAYFPNSQRDHARLPYKLGFCAQMEKHLTKLRKKKNVIVCGDWNIAHREIDLRNPKSNQDNAGFLPQERSWIDSQLKSGWTDAFRHFKPEEPDHYTWWSYRPGVREKNVGWRLDYFLVNDESTDRLKRSVHQTEVRGSDHCPVLLELK